MNHKQMMGNKKIKPIVLLIVFVGLTIFYSLFWEIAVVQVNSIYAIKKEIFIPISMALISTIGFYLKLRYK